MKKCVLWILSLLLLTGCHRASKELEMSMQLRSRILQSSHCGYTTDITADYGDQICHFTVDCTADGSGNVSFIVTEPTSISGISGRLTGEGGQLIFDDLALHFPLMADGLLSPISAPWILNRALRSGFLKSACAEDGGTHLSIEDQYENDSLFLDVWLDPEGKPSHADILHEGRRILTMTVRKFEIS